MTKLTIIIPTYNEAENVAAISEAILGLGLSDLSILFIDDGSPDGTGTILDELAARNPGRLSVLHREGKLGLGTAYITGFKHALSLGAEAVGQMDADFSHDPERIPDLIQQLRLYDFVIGSRYVPGGRLDERWGLWRVFLSRFGNMYARTILRIPIRDVTGGFRLWRRELIEKMPLERIRSNGYVFQVETAYVAHRLGFSHTEIPIYFEDRRIGQSKMSFRIQVEAALRVWQLPLIYRDLTA